ncbi:hypothetical protein ACFOEZ_01085 [Tianweitania populi]|uniref:Uncharacterized protein n=1 Tax=Tianweitania populi TaxID=1607949 RepID=A0A8J3DKE4_9HYPH|nr:hypothetical protein [Tianweitania populi]GHD04996.1 hypothetical protein GCM10016234_00300 [Tianweitania populi]
MADSDIVRRHLRLLDGLVMNPGEGAVERLLAADDPELAWYESETRPSLLRARIYLARYRVPRHMAYVAAELAMLSLSQAPARSCELMATALAWMALCREAQQRSASRSVTGFAALEQAFRVKFGSALVPQRASAG